jgi:hypothetical protein
MLSTFVQIYIYIIVYLECKYIQEMIQITFYLYEICRMY